MIFICVTAGLYDYYIHGTAMYYMIHSLPVPLHLTQPVDLSIRAHSIRSDELGLLTQTTDDDEEPRLPSPYKPSMSSLYNTE